MRLIVWRRTKPKLSRDNDKIRDFLVFNGNMELNSDSEAESEECGGVCVCLRIKN